MTYIALKPCSFAGQRFRIGAEIPEILLLPEAINGLVKMGVIAAGDGAQPVAGAQSPAKVEINVEVEEGTLALNISAEVLQDIFTAMCGMYGKRKKGNAVDARKIIYVAVRFAFICLLVWLCVISMIGTTSTPSIYADF